MIRRDLTNKQFGRLTALHVCGRDNRNRLIWLCSCSCGTQKPIRSRHLITGAVRSCGCLGKETAAISGRSSAYKHSGPLSHLYKPELSDEERAKRRDPKVKEWRRQVFERDNYSCQICFVRGTSLHAHHLNCWSSYPNERFVIDNGLTLCKTCHEAFHHSIGGMREECTKEDFLVFIENFVV